MRYYSSTAGKMTLPAAINAAQTTITLSSTVGLPGTTPFTLILDVGQPAEEIITVTAVSGSSITATRGEDGSTATAHPAGAVVRHGMSARDLRESREHEAATAQVHGISGSVVGTSDVQGLTNKNLTSGTNTFPASLATSAALTAHTGATAAHGATGAVVGTTNTQTLTNKTLTAPQFTDDVNVGSGASGTARYLTASRQSNTGNHAVKSKFYTASGAGSVAGNAAITVEVDTVETARVELDGVTGDLNVTGGKIKASNIPTTGVPGTSAAKAGKRLVPITTTVNPNATGYATVTHNLGFTPVHVTGNAEFAYAVGVDQLTSTTLRVRLLNPTTGAAATGDTLCMLNCWE